MKISVYVATTRGPVRIERITREAAPVSQICVGRTTSVLPISPDYDSFVRQPSGVIERALGPYEPGGFRLDASADIGDGNSWQLPVYVAHALAKEGALAGVNDPPDIALWVTGTVGVDLQVAGVEFVEEKLSASRDALATLVDSGCRVTVVVPDSNRWEAGTDLVPDGVGILGVRNTSEVLQHVELGFRSLALDGPAAEPDELVPLSMGSIYMPRWRLISMFVSMLVFAGIGTALIWALPEMAPGTIFRDCEVCPEMVVVPGGTFLMGSPPEELQRDDYEGPVHEVELKPFAIARYEVTRSQFTSFVEESGIPADDSCFVRTGSGGRVDESKSWRDPGYAQGPNDPVVCVDWNMAKAYLAWLSRRTGLEYRLPSEAEWEYAARGGTQTPFHVGSTITSDQANFNGTKRYGDGAKGVYRMTTTPVGSFPANVFGLHDVHGNAWEWVEDCWNDNYRNAPRDGTAWLSGNCGRRVTRGGAWSSHPGNIRSANRTRFILEYRNYNFGFRVVRDLGP